VISEYYDVVVIGAGIAGAGVAALLAGSARVAVLEKESHPGVHSTGRSAAMFFGSYGNDQIRALSRASRPFFITPPDGFAEGPLLKSRGSLIIAGSDQKEQLDRYRNDSDLSRTCIDIDVSGILEKCPLIDPTKVVGGMFEPDSFDIEVHELHQGYLKRLKANGGMLLTSIDITTIQRNEKGWLIEMKDRSITSPVLVNAAGAWADEIAQMAGVGAIGMEPRRRTAVLVPAPDGMDVGDMPMVMDISEKFYFKPDAGQILVSPADETLVTPCDAQPEDLDVAIAVDHFETLTSTSVKRVTHRWAGLRTFASDRTPVVGFDARTEGFFWLAGQGGYGIQTAPALSEFSARQILGDAVPQHLLDEGVDPAKLSPSRFINLQDTKIDSAAG
jgi:D-arginine dehydrogenase